MSPDKLAYMANQIAQFFARQPHAAAVAGIADHIRAFWDPRMRATILAYVEAGGEALHPLAHEAVVRLAQERAPAP